MTQNDNGLPHRARRHNPSTAPKHTLTCGDHTGYGPRCETCGHYVSARCVFCAGRPEIGISIESAARWRTQVDRACNRGTQTTSIDVDEIRWLLKGDA